MKTIYLVLPCYNEELVIKDSASKLKELMQKLINEKTISEQSKVYFVNDGSCDRTWELLEEICRENGLFGAISLSANCGHQNAILSGMMYVKDECDAVITLDADLQHDITAIPEFVKRFNEGYEIVYGVRKSREGERKFKKITGDTFYTVMQLSGAKLIRNHADYRLMSSKAIQALSGYEEANLFLRGIIPSMGFKSTTLEYQEKPRLAGESKYSLKKMLKLAADGITSFSIRPLQMISLCGVFAFILSIIMLIYALVVYLESGTVPGWTSIVAPIWFLGGIQLLSLGVVGEYIGKIYMETKHRPRYIVDQVIKAGNQEL
ncbi:MAG: glycosyltransferase family 2 protein [Lachnospiraceae bacterium]|nr:glycosyltransferase family 2 protein [Lachnospiraceae bacterium]